jgi:glycosyltransferase involved in cell wall biosynthesis
VHGTKSRYDIICFDDGSRDQSVTVIMGLRATIPCIWLFRSHHCLGTHAARWACVRATITQWLIFLDPDDLMAGNGTVIALQRAIDSKADIVQFGCVSSQSRESTEITAAMLDSERCWREPSLKLRELTGTKLRRCIRRGLVDWHVHRKVFRTAVYAQALQALPDEIKNRRLYRGEDLLHYLWITRHMTNQYIFVEDIGEVWFQALPDNSEGRSYQTDVAKHVECQVVVNVVRQNFRFRPQIAHC